MIACRDFAPQITETQPRGFLGILGNVHQYESFEAAVAAANAWIQQNSIRIINVETVVLPNLWQSHEEGTSDADLSVSGGQYGGGATWHQFVRVWYHAS